MEVWVVAWTVVVFWLVMHTIMSKALHISKNRNTTPFIANNYPLNRHQLLSNCLHHANMSRECDDHHNSIPRAHELSQNKKGEVRGFSSLNAVLGPSSSSKGSEFNHDWNYNYPSLLDPSTVPDLEQNFSWKNKLFFPPPTAAAAILISIDYLYPCL